MRRKMTAEWGLKWGAECGVKWGAEWGAECGVNEEQNEG